MKWKDELEFNKSFLDSLPLPEPTKGQNVYEYMNAVEIKFNKKELPSVLQNELFNFMTISDVADYLSKRF